jgi:hypothetical protein
MPDEQIEQTPAEQTINILSPEFQEPMDINLTRGQMLFIYQILERNIRPQGFEMIEFSMDLLNRFRTVLSQETTAPETETLPSGAKVIGGGTPQIDTTFVETETSDKTVDVKSESIPNNIGSTVPKSSGFGKKEE